MIELKNVTKKFGKDTVLNNISLTLSSGRIIGFVGRNGSGKSMLFRAICGFVIPTSGEIIVDGINLLKEHQFYGEMRALIEKPNFIGNMSGYDNLMSLAKIQNRIGEKEVEEVLKLVGLYEVRHKFVSKYSLGMKQKLGIAQVIMEDPKIMILDEPFNGLDEESTKKIRKILLDKKKEGKLILIATHIKEDVDTLCDEIYRIDHGSIMEVLVKEPIAS